MKSRSRLLRIKEVSEWINVSQSSIYKWVEQGRFPPPIKLGNKETKRQSARWIIEDVEEWIEGKRVYNWGESNDGTTDDTKNDSNTVQESTGSND
jgi:prophage regulatory protein